MDSPNNLPDVDSLRCFVAAAARLNFRAAAGDVHLSPAAFGERIKRLEEELGAPLFARTTRSVHLTPAGERLVAPAKQLLEGAGALFSAVHEAQEPPYVIVVGTRYELGLSWLVPLLPALERDAPARRIHLYFGDSDALLARLGAGRVDAAITSVRLASAGLDYVALHEEHYVLVASPKLVAERPLTKAAHAKAHVLLDVHPELPLFRYFLDRAEPEPAFTFERHECLGTIGAVKARVLAGVGVAVLPAYFVADELARRRLVRLFPKVELPTDWFRLIWRTGHPRRDALRQLGETLRRHPLR